MIETALLLRKLKYVFEATCRADYSSDIFLLHFSALLQDHFPIKARHSDVFTKGSLAHLLRD